MDQTKKEYKYFFRPRIQNGKNGFFIQDKDSIILLDTWINQRTIDKKIENLLRMNNILQMIPGNNAVKKILQENLGALYYLTQNKILGLSSELWGFQKIWSRSLYASIIKSQELGLDKITQDSDFKKSDFSRKIYSTDICMRLQDLGHTIINNPEQIKDLKMQYLSVDPYELLNLNPMISIELNITHARNTNLNKRLIQELLKRIQDHELRIIGLGLYLNTFEYQNHRRLLLKFIGKTLRHLGQDLLIFFYLKNLALYLKYSPSSEESMNFIFRSKTRKCIPEKILGLKSLESNKTIDLDTLNFDLNFFFNQDLRLLNNLDQKFKNSLFELETRIGPLNMGDIGYVNDLELSSKINSLPEKIRILIGPNTATRSWIQDQFSNQRNVLDYHDFKAGKTCYSFLNLWWNFGEIFKSLDWYNILKYPENHYNIKFRKLGTLSSGQVQVINFYKKDSEFRNIVVDCPELSDYIPYYKNKGQINLDIQEITFNSSWNFEGILELDQKIFYMDQGFILTKSFIDDLMCRQMNSRHMAQDYFRAKQKNYSVDPKDNTPNLELIFKKQNLINDLRKNPGFLERSKSLGQIKIRELEYDIFLRIKIMNNLETEAFDQELNQVQDQRYLWFIKYLDLLKYQKPRTLTFLNWTQEVFETFQNILFLHSHDLNQDQILDLIQDFQNNKNIMMDLIKLDFEKLSPDQKILYSFILHAKLRHQDQKGLNNILLWPEQYFNSSTVLGINQDMIRTFHRRMSIIDFNSGLLDHIKVLDSMPEYQNIWKNSFSDFQDFSESLIHDMDMMNPMDQVKNLIHSLNISSFKKDLGNNKFKKTFINELGLDFDLGKIHNFSKFDSNLVIGIQDLEIHENDSELQDLTYMNFLNDLLMDYEIKKIIFKVWDQYVLNKKKMNWSWETLQIISNILDIRFIFIIQSKHSTQDKYVLRIESQNKMTNTFVFYFKDKTFKRIHFKKPTLINWNVKIPELMIDLDKKIICPRCCNKHFIGFYKKKFLNLGIVIKSCNNTKESNFKLNDHDLEKIKIFQDKYSGMSLSLLPFHISKNFN